MVAGNGKSEACASAQGIFSSHRAPSMALGFYMEFPTTTGNPISLERI